jgi:hypothetical protein
MNAKEEKGWLRKAEADKAHRAVPVTAKEKPGQLSTTEKQLLLSLKQTLNFTGVTVAKAMSSTWGVGANTVRRIQKTSHEIDGLAVPRKVRFDKGDTILTSDAKCKRVYTAPFVYKKQMRIANRGR